MPENLRELFEQLLSEWEREFKIRVKNLHVLKSKIWRIVLIITIFLYSFSLIGGALSTYSPQYTIKRVTFTTQVSYERAIKNRDLLFDNVSILPDTLEVYTIHAYLIMPTPPKVYPLPAVVFQHGMVINKETNLHNAIEIACAGFCVLAPDLPGHGSSGGLWDLGINGLQSMWAAVEYLYSLPFVDKNRIAVSGHSNGGIVATRAGIFDKTPFGTGGKIKAVAAIFTISDLEQTIRYMVGKDIINDPQWGMIISSFAGCKDGIITEKDNKRRSVIDFINSTNIPNYFLMTGSEDQLTNITMQFQVFERATGGLYSVDELTSLYYNDTERDFLINNLSEENISFSKGNARQLVILKGQDHLGEMMHSHNFVYLIHWLIDSLDLNRTDFISRMESLGEEKQDTQEARLDFLYQLRFISWACAMGGTFLTLLMMGSIYTRKIFRKRKTYEPFLPSDLSLPYSDELGLSVLTFSKKQKSIKEWETIFREIFKIDYIGDLRKFINSWKEKIGYMFLIVIAFIIGISLAWIYQDYFTHYWILNQYILQYMYTAISLLVIDLIIYIGYKIGDRRAKLINLERIGLSFEGFVKSLKFVFIVVGTALILYNIAAWLIKYPFLFPRPFIEVVYRDFFITLLILFLFYFGLEVISKTQLFDLHYVFPNWKGYIQEIFVNGTIIWGLWIFSYIVGGLFMNENLKWLIVQDNTGAALLLIANAIMIGIQGVMAYFSAFLYQRSKNLFGVALFQATLITLLIGGRLMFIFSQI